MNKQQNIISMFDDIAKTYDVANRVLSMGVDTYWRKKGCEKALSLWGNKEASLIVDVATGTGDMMTYWEKAAKKLSVNVIRYVGIDPSSGMLDVAKEKFPQIEFIIAGAEALPLEDGVASMVSISYGIRNVVERQKAIEEFYRVLAPSGVLVILEFTKTKRSGFFGAITTFYLEKILPFLGGMISNNQAAYQYLPDSIEEFVTQEGLCQELKDAGFSIKHAEGFSFDISTLIIAQK